MIIDAIMVGIGVLVAWQCVEEKMWAALLALFFWIWIYASRCIPQIADYEVLETIGSNIAGLLFLAYIIKANIKKEGKIQ